MNIKFSEFITGNLFAGNAKVSLDSLISNKELLPQECLRTLSDREELLGEILSALQGNDNRVVYLNSPTGVGKTSLLKTIVRLLDGAVFTHYYECSEVTNLDDILLSLFRYLKRNTPRDADYNRNFRVSTTFSLDERVVNRIKNLEKPLLLVIDGAENIFCKGRESVSGELLAFLRFVQTIPAIRIIIAGETNLNSDSIKIHPIKIEGLDRAKAVDFIKAQSFTDVEPVIDDILKLTGGFPEKILLLATLSKALGITANELIKKINSSGIDAEKCVNEIVCSLIPDDYRDLTGFFALVRHPFSLDTLKKLDIIPEVEEKTAFLSSIMVLSENNGNFQIKQPLKNHIASRLSPDEKTKTHAMLEELYATQISSRLEDRILPVSRKILHSEQYYHKQAFARMDINGKRHAKMPDMHELGYDISFDNDEDMTIRLTEAEKSLVEGESENVMEAETSEYVSQEPPAKTDTTPDKKPDIQPALRKLSEHELKEMLANCEKQGDRTAYNSVLFNLANLYKEHFHHEQALTHYYSILNAAEAEVPASILFNLYENLGEIYSFRQDFSTALNWYTKALKAVEDNQNASQLAEIYFKHALAYDDAGDYDMALEFYSKNVDMSDNTEINPFLSASYSNMAAIFEEKGELTNTIKYYEKALKVDTAENNLEGQYEALSKLGDVYFETGNYAAAAKCFYGGLSVAKKLNDPYRTAMSYIDVGDFFLAEKSYEKTIKAYILAKKTIENTVSTDSKEKIERRLREVMNELGKERYIELIGKIKGKHA
ncbi:MAG: tetratricopeptide repeat protein [Candidatus Gastranaerophilales bacterium]|nr:tetratricopeptide repeat protein [Candidatus Gastranaerophilales bacterium]